LYVIDTADTLLNPQLGQILQRISDRFCVVAKVLDPRSGFCTDPLFLALLVAFLGGWSKWHRFPRYRIDGVLAD